MRVPFSEKIECHGQHCVCGAADTMWKDNVDKSWSEAKTGRWEHNYNVDEGWIEVW